MREVWSDVFRTQKYLDWEAALARAGAKVGLIPQEAADEVKRIYGIVSDSLNGLTDSIRRQGRSSGCMSGARRLRAAIACEGKLPCRH